MSAKYVPRNLQMRPGEMPMKAWVMEEAERAGVTTSAIYMRIHRGCYLGLKVRRANSRIVFVKP